MQVCFISITKYGYIPNLANIKHISNNLPAERKSRRYFSFIIKNTMKTNLNKAAARPYEAPAVELIEVAVEQGFAVSPGEVNSDPNDWEAGPNDGWAQ